VTNIEAAIAALPEVDPEVQAADLAASEAASKASAACDRLALARTELDRLAVALMDGAMERERLQPVASKLDALVQAEALASDLQAQVTTAGAEKAAIEAELATVPDPGQIVLPDTSAQEAAVQAAEKVAQETVAAIAVAETKLQAAKDRERKLEEFAQERRRLEDEISDWTRLGQDLGRGGLQAIEIDAAGPSLTEMINTLLRAVAGSRWTVSVETARWNKDGDKQIEGCEIQVVDTKENWTGPADRLSGGEKVMVGEAVSLAISLLACQRAGMEGITLVRDEAGAALDPQNAPLYVKMMRRAAEIVKADKVLFVSHSPDAVAEADSRIVIEDYSIRTAA
jgi:exonuclease SbcC